MPSLDTQLLADLMRAKRQRLTDLRALALKQAELIAAGSMTALLDLLTVKQRIIEDVQRVEQALQPYRSQTPDQRQWASPDLHDRCVADRDACERLLAEIVLREQQCEQDLVQQRAAAATQLQGVHLADVARHAYQPEAAVTHSQFDISSGT